MFYKKVLVLKQIEKEYSLGKKSVSGIARIEIENGVGDFFLSIINLRPLSKGNYYVFILDNSQKLFCFDLINNGSLHKPFIHLPDVKSLSVGIIHAIDFIPITVAFASTESQERTLKDFKKAVAEHFSTLRQKQIKDEQPAKQAPPEIEPSVYDDEVVATENYFEFDDVKDKLKAIEELDNEALSLKNELPFSGCKEEAQEILTGSNGTQDETPSTLGEKHGAENPYYLSVREELEEIFLKFPPEPALEKMFYKSKWAKLYYSENKYYVVGLVYEDEKEQYICYGVPGEYSSEPPKELAGYCSFIPLSVFSLHGDGYWMMFQDANSGECKKPL